MSLIFGGVCVISHQQPHKKQPNNKKHFPPKVLPPMSPSASSSCSSMPLVKRAKTISSPKQVRFQDACKKHDGLTERKQVYEHVIQQFFFHKIEISELFVLELVGYDVKKCCELFGDFQDLALRMKHEIIDEAKLYVPVLPRGGGSALRLFEDHFSYVVLLCRVIEAALNRLLHGLPIPSTNGPCVDMETGKVFSPSTVIESSSLMVSTS